jgi:murein DD-endopeptidase MepM/ murein hydrolase activator NlpD
VLITNASVAMENIHSEEKIKSITDFCEKSLVYYEDHPQLYSEYNDLLDFCKSSSKDLSPDGYTVNPIISDFGSMYGVNSRPRDSIHQGIDIIGKEDQPVIAIADGIVLETKIEQCWGPTLVIDHGKSSDGKNLIVIYGHVGELLVKENQMVKRGDVVARLPKKINFRCMARVRHLHLQIGQRYCKKSEKDNWGCRYFIKDFYRSLDPNKFWFTEKKKITCFKKNKDYPKGQLTYPFKCIKESRARY